MVGAWWQHPGVLERWVRDLLSAEMATLRPSGWSWPPSQDGADPLPLHLTHDLGADSLELMALSSALSEALDLRNEADLQQLLEQPTWGSWVTVARRTWASGNPRMRFRSSGSTGLPRTTEHPLAELQQEMQAMCTVLQEQGGRPIQRIVSAVRCHHIYGFLFTALLPCVRMAGRGASDGNATAPDHVADAVRSIAVLDALGLPPSAVVHRVEPGDVVVGFPDWWAQALRSDRPWPSGVYGITSTAPCPPALTARAQALGLQWFEIYGSSETAGVGWRKAPLPQFELHGFWRRSADDRLERLDADGRPLRQLLPPDHLDWTDARRFVPRARRDGVMSIGGTNVDPERVRQTLLTHPWVAEAAVRPHVLDSGTRLKAFVVLRESGAAAAQEAHTPSPVGDPGAADALMAWCRRHLVPAARPVDIRIGTQLPRNDLGKLRDWALD